MSTATADEGTAPAAGEPTFTKDVSRFLQKNCQTCHRPGGIGPFSLMTYRQAKAWAPMIQEVIDDGRMPPWHADPNHGKFKNDRRLSENETKMINAWIDGEMLQGDPADMPEPLVFTEEWRMGKPDVVFTLPKPITIDPTGVMPYQEIEVPTNFTEDKWIEAMEAKAGNAKVVHHIIVFCRAPQYQSGTLEDFQRIGRGFLAGFAPGTIPTILGEGRAIKIPAGSNLIFQMHYTPTGKTEVDQSSFGVRFATEPVTHEVLTATTVNTDFRIPPGDPAYEVQADTVFPENAIVYAMTPHMHYRGKSFQYIAHYPDGKTETLLSVPRYDFNWQTTYILETPAYMPKGTRLQTIAHFDNSANNPANPDPTKFVKWGDQTWEEMMIGWMDLSWCPDGPGEIKVSRNDAVESSSKTN